MGYFAVYSKGVASDYGVVAASLPSR